MERITFGMTDGDAEAAVLSPIQGYNVRIGFSDGSTIDAEVLHVDNTRIVVGLIDDESERTGETQEFSYAAFEELHIF
jgi:hypothetical protein